MKNKLTLFTRCGLLSFALLRCDEQLPLSVDPAIALTGHIDVDYVGKGDPTVVGPDYNTLKLYIWVRYPRATFDETLQGEGELAASMEIVWMTSPTHKKTVLLDRTALVENRRYKYDAEKNIVTMDPGDEMAFFYSWDLVDDDGIYLGRSFPMVVDSTCIVGSSYPRKIPFADFRVTGTAKVFRQFAVTKEPETRFMMSFKDYHVPCPH